MPNFTEQKLREKKKKTTSICGGSVDRLHKNALFVPIESNATSPNFSYDIVKSIVTSLL